MPMNHGLPKDFHKLFSAWQRLEPRSRSATFEEGIKAATADPLWYLNRQWQMGEFQAEDAGSLVRVEIKYRSEAIDAFTPGNLSAQPLTSSSPPFETLVEREPVPWDWRMRIRTGQQFERLLLEAAKKHDEEGKASAFLADLRRPQQAGGCGIVSSDAAEADRMTQRKVSLLAGRGINGEMLFGKIGANQLNTSSGLAQTILDEAVSALKEWHASLFCQPEGSGNGNTAGRSNPCWQPTTLDYHFGVKAPNGDKETRLSSRSYRNGDLEWYSSNLESEGHPTEPTGEQVVSANPTRATFAGMPHVRWWAMEDSAVDIARMDVGKTDLIKPLLTEFVSVFGDDWYVVPLALPPGSINHISKVTTVDVFGVTQGIELARVTDPDPLQRWDLFSLSNAADPAQNAVADFLYLPFSAGYREESDPIEEVRFVRDEGANLVWGVEHTMTNGWGKPVSVSDLKKEAEEAAPLTTSQMETGLKYQLASPVPSNWIPFIPVQVPPSSEQTKLIQAAMPGDNGEELVQPATRIIADPVNGCDELNEEAIPSAGIKVQLTKQRVRWIDGKTYVWLGKKVVTGRGEASSGLEFDRVILAAEGNGG